MLMEFNVKDLFSFASREVMGIENIDEKALELLNRQAGIVA